jgi:hypothetical protein
MKKHSVRVCANGVPIIKPATWAPGVPLTSKYNVEPTKGGKFGSVTLYMPTLLLSLSQQGKGFI